MPVIQNGKDRNGKDVTINEVTLSIRAVSNSPHDAVTFDAGNGIRGVNLGGRVLVNSEDTAIRSVNISFDGVSVDCPLDFLLMLADCEFREAFVARIKREHEEKEALADGLGAHDWEGAATNPQALANETAHPGFRAWQCALCKVWTSVKALTPESTDDEKEFIHAHDNGLAWPIEPGCHGAPAAHDPMTDKCNRCGEIRADHAAGFCPGMGGPGSTDLWSTDPADLLEAKAEVAAGNVAVDIRNAEKAAKRTGKAAPKSRKGGRR